MMNFVRCLFYICWGDHVIFSLPFILFYLFICCLLFLMFSLPFNNVLYHIDLQLLNHSYIFEINFTSSCCMILLKYCWIVCSYFVDNLSIWIIYVHQWYYPVVSFLCGVLVYFDIEVMLALWVWMCSLFCFFGIVWEGLVLILLWMFGRIYQWSCLVSYFCSWRVLKLLIWSPY